MSAKPLLRVSPKCRMQFDGWVGRYLVNITDHWLKLVPISNPGILEVFRLRDVVPRFGYWGSEGESTGKYLTGAVEVLRATGDPELRQVLSQFVRTLISYQGANGYLGAWPKDSQLTGQAPNVRFTKASFHHGPGNTWDLWSHNHLILGLLRWSEHANDRAALAGARKIGDLLCRRFLDGKRRMLDTGNPVNLTPIQGLAMLHRRTGEQRYLELAIKATDELSATTPEGRPAGNYLEHAEAGRRFHETENPRWEMLHVLMGLGEIYWCTGDLRYRRAFEHYWWGMAECDRHNTGGFSTDEMAKGDPYDPGSIETCSVIAWIAMSVQMLSMTGNSIIADELELATINAVGGLFSCSGRWVTYDTPMNGIRELFKKARNWQALQGTPELSCCSANAPRGFGALGDWAVMRDHEGIVLNYYGPGEFTVTLRRGVDVCLTLHTDYPRQGRITLDVSTKKLTPFTLKLRIPHWSRKTSVAVNGRAIRDVRPGQYLSLARQWKRGDQVRISLDMSPHFWVGEGYCAGKVSMYRGPILMTYDPRFNTPTGSPVIDVDRARCLDFPLDESKAKPTGMLKEMVDRSQGPNPNYPYVTDRIPPLDAAAAAQGRLVRSAHWLEPVILAEYSGRGGKKVRLCDFASAGETGIPYQSWLKITGVDKTPFSPSNPLRSGRAK